MVSDFFNPFYSQNKVTTEAEQYSQIAIQAGVPENSIIVEDKFSYDTR